MFAYDGEMQSEIFDLFRGHEAFLRSNPDNLAAGQDPRLLVISCADSRVPPDLILNAEPGSLFSHRNIGGFVAPEGTEDPSLQAFLNYPLTTFDNVKALTIMGHTNCGGVKGLVHAILNEANPQQNDVTGWVQLQTDERLEKAVRDAHANGASVEEIARVVEYLMPVVSAMRLMQRSITVDGQSRPVGEFLDEKGITLVPAVYDLDTRQIQLFDPKKLQYQPISDIELMDKPARPEPSRWAERLWPNGDQLGAPSPPARLADGHSPDERSPRPEEKRRQPFAPGSTVSMGAALTPQQLAQGFQVGLNELRRLGRRTEAAPVIA